MKLAVIGSRTLHVKNLGDYLPEGCDEIVSGGAKGIDTDAEKYAIKHGIKLTIFPPDYKKYGKAAPLRRNDLIADYADQVVAFWDGKSKGTKYAVYEFMKRSKDITLI